MTPASLIVAHLDSVGAGTARHGTATIEELMDALKMDYDTVWEAVAVLLLRREVFVRSILKKRILVVKKI